ncbi:MAG: CDP-glycerol glycerophosphotransferase family protein [Candidatus Omnitrophota bacterium]
MFVEKFKQYEWFNERNTIVSGHPKLDYAEKTLVLTGSAWKRGMSKNVKRILWTPRWRTQEGTCHFFDYKDFFKNFCKNHLEVDFVFRPHPLCLRNFLKLEEMSLEQFSAMEFEYECSPNRVIDKTGSYQDTFLTSDILVSDISSMMPEYFVTGKPIVYTHRVDQFNEFGVVLSKGFYWVRNEAELKSTLEMLLSGKDPLRVVRSEIIKTELFKADGGAGLQITKRIWDDFNSC